MNEIANFSLELIIWILRIALVGLIYAFVWHVFRTLIKGDQYKSQFAGTDVFLTVEHPGSTLLPRNKVYEIYDKSMLGRKSDCTVVLNDPRVSDYHAEIIKPKTKWYIRDLGSTNNTYVNGLQVNVPTEVCDGDMIAIVDIRLQLHIVEKNK